MLAFTCIYLCFICNHLCFLSMCLWHHQCVLVHMNAREIYAPDYFRCFLDPWDFSPLFWIDFSVQFSIWDIMNNNLPTYDVATTPPQKVRWSVCTTILSENQWKPARKSNYVNAWTNGGNASVSITNACVNMIHACIWKWTQMVKYLMQMNANVTDLSRLHLTLILIEFNSGVASFLPITVLFY